MRLSRWLTTAAASVAIVTTVGAATAAASPRPTTPTYYLSLGDSLSVGVQPDSQGHLQATGQGYADDLFAAEKAAQPGLHLVKLGCSGETTRTMVTGGVCTYPGSGSQLEAAAKFLREHRGSVRLVTIDLGANDLDSCFSPSTGLDAACAQAGLNQVATTLPGILQKLRAADPRTNVRFAGMDYYDPFLAARLLGPIGQPTADESLKLTTALNQLLTDDYRKAGFAVAPVAHYYATHDTHTVTVPGLGAQPRNVAEICRLTWACTLPPVGPDIHANAAGYKVIANAFHKALEPARAGR
jgi:lysophospholipase L1-like esterase